MPITAWRILLASSEPCPGIYIALWARHGTARSLLCLTCDLSMFFGDLKVQNKLSSYEQPCHASGRAVMLSWA